MRTTTTFLSTPSASAVALRAGRTLGGSALALFDTLLMWVERHRQRRALEALPDHLLHDIGLSRADAAREADKPFWKA